MQHYLLATSWLICNQFHAFLVVSACARARTLLSLGLDSCYNLYTFYLSICPHRNVAG
jgi:hypothetical protein